MLVALEAALGGTVDGQRHVFGIAEAADVDGLATGFQRAALADAGQGLQQAGDVVGLVAVDIGLAQGGAADSAGVDLAAGADHAQGFQLDGAALGGPALLGAHDVGAADFDQGELTVVEQAANRHFRGELAVERRRLHILEQGFVKQQRDLCLLRHLAQGRGQRLGGQVQGERLGNGREAERQAGSEEGRTQKQVRSVARRAKHEIPRCGQMAQKVCVSNAGRRKTGQAKKSTPANEKYSQVWVLAVICWTRS